MDKDPKEVLVIQKASGAVDTFCRLLKMAADGDASKNLVMGEDFLAFSTADGIEKMVFDDRPQLLITGIISHTSLDDVAELVERLHQKNPQLVVVAFSTWRLTGRCFDRQIEKMKVGSSAQVIKAILDFRSGILRRGKGS